MLHRRGLPVRGDLVGVRVYARSSRRNGWPRQRVGLDVRQSRPTGRQSQPIRRTSDAKLRETGLANRGGHRFLHR